MTDSLTDLDTAAEFTVRLIHLDPMAEQYGTSGLWVNTYLSDNDNGTCTYWVNAGHNVGALHHVASFDFSYSVEGLRQNQVRLMGYATGFTIEDKPASDDEGLLIWLIKGAVRGLNL